MIVLIGIAALAFLIWEPQVEGVNVRATFTQMYLQDPFILYVYVGSIAFFLALHRWFRVLGFIAAGNAFTKETVRDLRAIKRYGLAVITFIAGAEAFIIFVPRGEDEIQGGIAMGVFAFLIAAVIVAAADVCQQVLADRH